MSQRMKLKQGSSSPAREGYPLNARVAGQGTHFTDRSLSSVNNEKEQFAPSPDSAIRSRHKMGGIT